MEEQKSDIRIVSDFKDVAERAMFMFMPVYGNEHARNSAAGKAEYLQSLATQQSSYGHWLIDGKDRAIEAERAKGAIESTLELLNFSLMTAAKECVAAWRQEVAKQHNEGTAK